MSAPTSIPSDLVAFLSDQGYELKQGHFIGYESGNVIASQFKKARQNIEIYSVAVRGKHAPHDSGEVKWVCRPTIPGLRCEWFASSN